MRKSILVAGSGLHEFDEICRPLGVWLAEQGYNLITGGGQGVMKSVARGFCSAPREGLSIGILAGRYENGIYKPSEPNEFVEIPIFTHLWGSRGQSYEEKAGPSSRNHITALSADAVVVVDGDDGTRAEAEIAGAQGKPIIFYGGEGCRKEWHARFLERHGSATEADTLEDLRRILP